MRLCEKTLAPCRLFWVMITIYTFTPRTIGILFKIVISLLILLSNMVSKMYTRQNKLRVRPRSKQYISVFSRMPSLIQLPKC